MCQHRGVPKQEGDYPQYTDDIWPSVIATQSQKTRRLEVDDQIAEVQETNKRTKFQIINKYKSKNIAILQAKHKKKQPKSQENNTVKLDPGVKKDK